MPKSKNSHNAKVGSVVERTDDRIKSTGEVFTPMSLVYEMIDEIPIEKMRDPRSTFLDNSCGSGNFLAGLLDRLTNKFGHTHDHVITNMIFGLDLMEDNIKETCVRLGVVYGENPHFVCANALTYDYSFGEPVGLEAFF
jgi:hypothetical protein